MAVFKPGVIIDRAEPLEVYTDHLCVNCSCHKSRKIKLMEKRLLKALADNWSSHIKKKGECHERN